MSHNLFAIITSKITLIIGHHSTYNNNGNMRISKRDMKWRRRQWHPSPVLLPGESQGWRSLVGCSPWGRKESDTTEWLHFHFSLSCIGEGNGNPLQCSCLENPRDGGAWWAAVYGVAQSRTWLKQLSSSNRHEVNRCFFLKMTNIDLWQSCHRTSVYKNEKSGKCSEMRSAWM